MRLAVCISLCAVFLTCCGLYDGEYDDYDDYGYSGESCESFCDDLCHGCHTYSYDIDQCARDCEYQCDIYSCDYFDYSDECADIFQEVCSA